MCELSGYYLNNNKSSQLSLTQNFKLLNKVIPTWLELKENGNLVQKNSDDEVGIVKSTFEDKNIIPLLQNYQLKSSVSNEFLNNKGIWLKTANKIIEYLTDYSYQEININLEGIKKYNQDNLINCIKLISSKLDQHHLKTGLSIPAKIDDNSSEWAGAYDYCNLGKISERVIIMAYDYHWANGSPGPIAPLPWVQDVIDYAIMNIKLKKIYLGIPLYGYDWLIDDERRSARGLSFGGIISLKNRFKVSIQWDQESRTPYLIYKDNEGEHEVWFENRDSILYKLELVKKYQLGGAVFWRLGLEDPALWTEIKEKGLFKNK